MIFRADLHLHSCLSPCGGLDMSPTAIVQRARECGLNALALTDHNTARNSPAWRDACRRCGMAHLFGMEVNTMEEAHILCYFDDLEAVMEFDRLIYDSLPCVRNDPVRFGDQVIVNVREEIEGEVEKYLHGAAGYSIAELTVLVHEMDGLVVPSHVDRDAF
ncbi:MAG: PHP domain-containing protein, partial [Kiritimatiellae bacterium]|nr:PHP domain-containing protein [Kiritimatiellia bacterium]